MTPERLAEIRAYIRWLDLDQLPPWTVEHAIIRDLWEAVEAVRKLHSEDLLGFAFPGHCGECQLRLPCPTIRALDFESDEHRADVS
jgi:hypothetical protein